MRSTLRLLAACCVLVAGLRPAGALPAAMVFDFDTILEFGTAEGEVEWSPLDAAWSPTSGSMRLVSTTRALANTCVPLSALASPASLRISAQVLVAAADPAQKLTFLVGFSNATNCSNIYELFPKEALFAEFPARWVPHSMVWSIPPAAKSVRLTIETDGAATVYLDDIVLTSAAGSACARDLMTHCLQRGRFMVRAKYTAGGATRFAHALPETDDSGLFWFFDRGNVELMLKVLDGCGLNGRFWVFAAGLTNVGVEIDVVDTKTGGTWKHSHAAGRTFATRLDTEALATCP